MIRRTFEAIGVAVFLFAVLFQYAPGIAERLGLPAAQGYECPGTYWKLPDAPGYIHCTDLELHGELLKRGLMVKAAELRLAEPPSARH